jgi:hypothetical protein
MGPKRDWRANFDRADPANQCGKSRLLEVPLLGRAIFVFDDVYTLCTVCGAMCTVGVWNRVGVDVCCGRCDPALILPTPPPAKPPAEASAAARRSCRFCGKRDNGAPKCPWPLLVAPFDDGPDNASLPPPLRRVVFCKPHTKAWTPGALLCMSTRSILAHVVSRAKPVLGGRDDADLASSCHAGQPRIDAALCTRDGSLVGVDEGPTAHPREKPPRAHRKRRSVGRMGATKW